MIDEQVYAELIEKESESVLKRRERAVSGGGAHGDHVHSWLSRIGVPVIRIVANVVRLQVVDIVVIDSGKHLMSLDEKKRHHCHLQ